MFQDDLQERTEQPTQKKERESKERGLVARSKDFNALLVLFFGCLSFVMFGQSMCSKSYNLFQHFFSFEGYSLSDNDFMFSSLKKGFVDGLIILLPIFSLIVIACVLGVILMGGWTFSLSNAALKFERLDPIKGLSKIFSLKSLMELFKSFLKVFLVMGSIMIVAWLYCKDIMHIGYLDLFPGIYSALHILVNSFFILAGSLIIISLFDVPFQIWDYRQQLLMTKQEIKDEYKESEGRPEVKSKIRKLQREMAKRRMMTQVPQADVIITNPTHYAVVLKYEDGKMRAPLVVAKGADLVAERIIALGKEHLVPIVEMPPLARSIFHFTEIGEEIPQKLYRSVAQVLAYVHQLKLYRRGKSKKPKLPTKIEIPSDMLK